jgi:ADP-ribose pyrophosphatase
MDRNDVELKSRRVAYSGFGKVLDLALRHRRFDGSMSEWISREVYERAPVAAVLLYDPARDAVVLVEQFRAGVYHAGADPWLLEVVAGLTEPGESPEDVARREAVEEASCTITALERICTVFTSPGGTSESCTIFCGRVDSAGAGGVHGLADEHEDIRVLAMGRAEAVAGIASGRIVNAKTVIALQWLALNHERLRAAWR